MWARGQARPGGAAAASFTIPIGRTTEPEPLTLDFLRDGPHGLLIGKTGSGKSELLRSIIAGLAILYPPDQVNFVLVDYKGGLGLDAYAKLPHTLAFLTNLQQAGQTKRFLSMLESEMLARQEQRKARVPMPRLFVIIDEFAEMVARRSAADADSDQIMEQILRILRLGRQLDVHLLFASQRPESAFSKLRGYVQYRISLRTDSEEDSKEIIGRPDAALLPAAFPGRGYLLRGDYQLQEFQAARVALPLDDALASQQATLDPEAPTTNDELIVKRISEHRAPAPGRWPAPLPTSEPATPTPLVLYLHGPVRKVSGAWGSTVAMPARPPVMTAPVGWYDRPDQRAQNWFNVDLLGHKGAMHGGPLLVMGDLNAGKTTTLQTLMLFLTTQYTPEELRVFAIDPTGAFQEFAAMRHTRDVREPDERNIIDGSSEADFEAWRGRFQRAMELDHTTRPRLLLLVDDFDDVSQRLTQKNRDLLHKLAQEVTRGRPRSLYLAVSAAKQGFDTLPGYLLSAMSTKIVLHMSNKDTMGGLLGLGRLPTALEAAPGRGFAQTRSTIDQIQIAAPVYGGNEVERVEGIREILAQTPWRVG
jgi:S-DNA-T family DNA segregation ATPase FtsK/SpoIIIE